MFFVMKYKLIVLNKSMNVVYSSCFSVHSLNDLRDKLKLHSETFWKLRFKDEDVSMRLLPDDDKSLDFFTSNNNPLIF